MFVALIVLFGAVLFAPAPAATADGTTTPAGGGFTDIPTSHPFYAEIMWAQGEEIITGYPDETFRPTIPVSRQSAAALLYRYSGAPNGVDPSCSITPFTDIPTDHPFCGEITWAVDNGITTGFDDGTFRPTTAVTRQSAAVFLYRLAGMPNGVNPTCTTAPFTDIPTDHPFCGEIAWAVDNGITTGYGDGTFRPTGAVTRQSMVAFLYRYDASFPITGVAQVSMGRFSSCALLGDATLRCWGANGSGQLGNGSYDQSPTAKTVSDLANVDSVANGTYHTCAVFFDATVKCWGTNSVGQLGLGSTTPLSSPTPVTVPGLTGVTQVSANDYNTCARISDGTVKCWGANDLGQIGLGTTSVGPVTTPTTVPGLTGVSKVAVGRFHVCAALTAGGVKCWGANDRGQLGDGTTTERHAPVSVSITSVVDIAAAWSHTCAVRSDGGVRCWGSNDRYESRGASGTDVASPFTIPGVSTADHVAVGNSHSCVHHTNGTLTCWGDNWSGQMAQGAIGPYSAPVAIAGLTNAITVAAAQNQVCAVFTNHTAKCWGENSTGQLGDGTLETRASPTPVDRGH